MGRFFKFILTALLCGVFAVSCSYDDRELKNDVDELQDSIEELLSAVDAIEEDVQALQAIVDALQNNVYVTSVVETGDGYTIYLSDNTSISIRNGQDGEDGQDADSLFQDVRVEGDYLVVVLVDGTEVKLPMFSELWFNVTATDGVEAGMKAEFTLDSKGVEQFSVVRPTGWKVDVQENTIVVEAPEAGLDYAEYSGTLDFIVTGSGKTIITKVPVYAYVWGEEEGREDKLLDFESDYYLMRLADAGDNYGSAFYNIPLDDEWGGMTFVKDDAYSVFFGLNESWGAYNLFGGGIVVSSSNNMEVSDYTNQLSVYYKDPVTGNGGFGGSERFAVHYGCANEALIEMDMDSRTTVNFSVPTKPVSVQVANSTYAYLLAKNGSQSNEALTYDNKGWLKIVMTAMDEGQNELGSVEFYLADFRTESSPGLLEGWNEFDLDALPECYSIMINLEGSDSGDYGLNTPAYFCFDNLATSVSAKIPVKVRL